MTSIIASSPEATGPKMDAEDATSESEAPKSPSNTEGAQTSAFKNSDPSSSSTNACGSASPEDKVSGRMARLRLNSRDNVSKKNQDEYPVLEIDHVVEVGTESTAIAIESWPFEEPLCLIRGLRPGPFNLSAFQWNIDLLKQLELFGNDSVFGTSPACLWYNGLRYLKGMYGFMPLKITTPTTLEIGIVFPSEGIIQISDWLDLYDLPMWLNAKRDPQWTRLSKSDFDPYYSFGLYATDNPSSIVFLGLQLGYLAYRFRDSPEQWKHTNIALALRGDEGTISGKVEGYYLVNGQWIGNCGMNMANEHDDKYLDVQKKLGIHEKAFKNLFEENGATKERCVAEDGKGFRVGWIGWQSHVRALLEEVVIPLR